MKSIYRDIISEGEGTIAETSGDNAKGENLGLIAGAELFRMVELSPEMLETLKILRSYIGDRGTYSGYIPFKPWDDLNDLISKAEGHE